MAPDDKRLVSAPRELDIDGSQLLWPKIEAAIDWNSAILIDMSACEFVDSTGLGVIIRAARELRSRQSRLGIVGLVGQPLQLFRLTRTDSSREIRLFETHDEARTELGVPATG